MVTAEVTPEVRLAARMYLSRDDLRRFCRLVAPNYQPAAHTDYLIDRLQALEQRTGKRKLMVFMPPQVGKSYHVSQRFPAWYMGRNPSHDVILASYASELAESHSRAVRDLMSEDVYPFDVDVAPDNSAAKLWASTGGGKMRAAGVGGGLTGFGANLAIIDDPFKDREEADSQTIRDKVWGWYQDVLRTRVRADGLMVLMLTRWHEDDLAGRILAGEDASEWEVVVIPAIAEESDLLGRPVGEALQPVGYGSPAEYARQLPSVARGETSSRSFAALYQQRPAPEEGGMLKRSWMQRWASLPPSRVDERGNPYAGPWMVIQTVDSAWDEGVGHDYSVIATWGTDGVDRFLLNIWRKRVEYPDLKAAIRKEFTTAQWRPRAIFVEDAANGRPVIQELKRTGLPVIGRKPVGSKVSRLDAVTPWFESGHVYVPSASEWVDEWITEHLLFPNVKHDDQVDTTSSALGEIATIVGRTRGTMPMDVRGGQPEIPANASAFRKKYMQEQQAKSMTMPRAR